MHRLIITDAFFGGCFAATAEVIEDVTIDLFSACPLHCQPVKYMSFSLSTFVLSLLS